MRVHAAILTEIVGSLIGEALFGGDAVEAAVALQCSRWQLRTHRGSVDQRA
jgi:hypothetical protein